ncbi:MAG TPA: vitamin B12 dependent methionine synthase [Deltaproteobacteria bacterium]|nr:vitamin B12 dependent methionine synthase [Deltaproteobacteria bacterium]
MNRIILDRIPFEIDGDGLAELLKIKPGSRNHIEFLPILEEARAIAGPKAVFAVASASLTGNDAVDIGGVRFTSRLLHANLEKAGVVYPFAATCGTELEEWSMGMKGMLHSFWADSIMLMALGCAVSRLDKYIEEITGGGKLSCMNPGSLIDWPIEQQEPLFALLGEAALAIGVSLTDRMVIRPLKSVSGILFVSENGFVNCALCPREKCPSRRADYHPDLYASRFMKQ